jgi:phosphoribosylanthranilate isomerase
MLINIKTSGIANLTDARYFAAKEVQFLGFCLDNADENFVQPLVVKAIKEWVAGPQILGEFGMQTTEEITDSIEKIGLDAIQLSFFSQADTTFLRAKTKVFKEIIVEKTTSAAELWQNIEHFGTESDALLLDFEKNNISWADIVRSPEFSIELLQRACQQYTIFLSLKFTAPQLNGIISALAPAGISLKGGEEEKVGVKSFDELDEIFEELEELN